MLTVHVDLARRGEPWQHRVGRRCRLRLKTAPTVPSKRLKQRWPRRQTIMERLGMHVEEVPR